MKNTNINKAAFWPALICLAVLVGAGVFATDALGSLLNTILYGMADRAGWFFELFAIICVILTFVLALSKYLPIFIPCSKNRFSISGSGFCLKAYKFGSSGTSVGRKCHFILWLSGFLRFDKVQ